MCISIYFLNDSYAFLSVFDSNEQNLVHSQLWFPLALQPYLSTRSTYSSALKNEAARSSEKSVHIYQITWCCVVLTLTAFTTSTHESNISLKTFVFRVLIHSTYLSSKYYMKYVTLNFLQ